MRANGMALVSLLAMGSGLGACGGGSSGSSSSVCSEVQVNAGGDLAIHNCSSATSTVSGITYDQYGRPVAYGFDVTCTSSGKHYTGHVGLSYNSLGQVVSHTLTVNGQTCP